MKKTFLFLLLACALVSNAQNVLIKDSSFVLLNGILTDAPLVQSYTYNTNCRVIIKKSPLSQSLYSYYANGNLYQETDQYFDVVSSIYINSLRTTFTYTNSNKLSSTITENRDAVTNSLINESKDSLVYDDHNYTIGNLIYQWDTATNTWVLSTKIDYYNNIDNGFADSSISFNYNSKSTTKTYYTYTSLKPSTLLSYVYDSANALTFTQRQSYFYDSSNLVSTDSIVSEYKFPTDATFMLISTSAIKTTYNADGTANETAINSLLTALGFITTQKIFYFYAPCSEALPATLLSFSGEQKNNNAVLHWQTANEINTAYFTILRSTDAVNFTTIGKVRATGNSSVQKDYTYTDANINLLNTTKVYYKLAVTSNDGKIAYSKIVQISVAAGKLYVSVSPNPFTNSITVNVPEALHDAKVTISDMNGKILYTAAQSTLSGTLRIDASRFAKGIYVITIRSAADKQVFKIVK